MCLALNITCARPPDLSFPVFFIFHPLILLLRNLLLKNDLLVQVK